MFMYRFKGSHSFLISHNPASYFVLSSVAFWIPFASGRLFLIGKLIVPDATLAMLMCKLDLDLK